MASSHPPTLLTLARRALRDDIALPKGSRVLVATSGGPDSMALLDVLAKLSARDGGFTIVAHGVDHGLRPAARAELDLVERACESMGVAFRRTRVRVDSSANVQARAREARHRALEAARRKARAQLIATAHHADDRAETVLMRVLRGAGPSGLAVLPPRDGRLIRPLIRARRSDILLHLERHGVLYASDPSNDDPRFLRTRIRQAVLPLLATLDPRVVEHLCALADDLAPAREDGATVFPLSRATRKALARLAVSTNKDGVVLLPEGLVATRQRKP